MGLQLYVYASIFCLYDCYGFQSETARDMLLRGTTPISCDSAFGYRLNTEVVGQSPAI